MGGGYLLKSCLSEVPQELQKDISGRASEPQFGHLLPDSLVPEISFISPYAGKPISRNWFVPFYQRNATELPEFTV